MLCYIISKDEYIKATEGQLKEEPRYVHIGSITDIGYAKHLASQFPCHADVRCYGGKTPCCYIVCDC